MNRKELVDYIAENYTLESGRSVTKKDAREYIIIITDAIKKAVLESGGVDLADFGSFKMRDIPKKEIFSPFHNKKIITEAKRKVSFAPYAAFTNLINNKTD